MTELGFGYAARIYPGIRSLALSCLGGLSTESRRSQGVRHFTQEVEKPSHKQYFRVRARALSHGTTLQHLVWWRALPKRYVWINVDFFQKWSFVDFFCFLDDDEPKFVLPLRPRQKKWAGLTRHIFIYKIIKPLCIFKYNNIYSSR